MTKINDERKNLKYSYISVKNKFIEHSSEMLTDEKSTEFLRLKL